MYVNNDIWDIIIMLYFSVKNTKTANWIKEVSYFLLLLFFLYYFFK